MSLRFAGYAVRSGLGVAAFISASLVVSAQAAQKVEIKRAKVVYASGNDLVVKSDGGKVQHFTVPPGTTVKVDGKDTTVDQLKVGTELTQTITTSTKDTTVTSVRKIDAKVWEVNAPYLTVSLPDGTNKRVKVPDGTKFNIDGEQKTVFELKKGMQLTGTIVTKTPETIVSSKKVTTGTAPPMDPSAVPPLVGVLLIEEVEILK